ncbi:hypothetical protein [Leisingera sp. ANG-Vp]|uniref:hypothetical protein n=1 Tax=Leisingera sp. ANG-Vp TaxID=1577896 RepID=UPI00126A7937|nr:hypothetical protein [Leisingera sp. ANG-Vp]
MLTHQRFCELEEFAAKQLIEYGQSPQRVVLSLARQYPEVAGLTIAFALTSIAHHLERPLVANNPQPLPKPIDIYRAISLLSSDLFELHVNQKTTASGADLVELWKRNSEEFFCAR